MKKALLLLCLLIFLVTLSHQLCLDAAPMRQVAFSDIPVLTETEYRTMRLRLPWLTDSLNITADGQTLPSDNTGLIYTPAAEGITVQLPARAKIARTAFETDEHGNTSCKIIRYDGVSRSTRSLLVTDLPVLDLQLIDRESENIPIGDEGRQLGVVRMFFKDTAGRITVQTEAATARVRGASSRQYEKKSYAIAFVDETGASRHAQLMDLPADAEYGLNSLYEDDSKIRDMLSLQLWAMLDADGRKAGEKANAISMRYTELLIDGQYWGLYGLHQLITPTALSIESGDALYKIDGQFFSTDTAPISVSAAEVVTDTPDGSGSAMLHEAFAVLPSGMSGNTPTLSFDNALDYALFLELACADDNDSRNMAACYRAADKAFRLIGWDLDQTFGCHWTGTGPFGVGNDFSLMEYSVFSILPWDVNPFSLLYRDMPQFAEAFHSEYARLRQTMLTDAALLEQANLLFDTLTDSGARAREAERWPDGGHLEDNRFIQEFISTRMAVLDARYAPAF